MPYVNIPETLKNIPKMFKVKYHNKHEDVALVVNSIAFEEASLAELIEAQSEEIKYISQVYDYNINEDTIKIKDIIDINKSINNILEKVIQFNILEQFTLIHVMNIFTKEIDDATTIGADSLDIETVDIEKIEAIDSHTIDSDEKDTEAKDTEAKDKEAIDKEVIDTEAKDKEVIDKEVIDKEVIDKEVIDTETKDIKAKDFETIDIDIEHIKADETEVMDKKTGETKIDKKVAVAKTIFAKLINKEQTVTKAIDKKLVKKKVIDKVHTLKGRMVGNVQCKSDYFYEGISIFQGFICTKPKDIMHNFLCYSVQKGIIMEVMSAIPQSLKMAYLELGDRKRVEIRGEGKITRKERFQPDNIDTCTFVLNILHKLHKDDCIYNYNDACIHDCSNTYNNNCSFEMTIKSEGNTCFDHHSGVIEATYCDLHHY